MNLLTLQATCQDAGLMAILYTVKNVLKLIQIIVPILLLVVTAINFTKLVMNPEDKKGLKKVINSFLAAAIVFLIPVLANATFALLDDQTTFSDCWNKATKKVVTENNYVDPYDSGERKLIYEDPSDYIKESPKPSTSPSSTTTQSSTSQQTGGTSSNGNNTNESKTTSNTSLTLIREETSTNLKVNLYKESTYYITKIWVKNAYTQLNKYDSPEYGKKLYKPSSLLERAITEKNLENDLVVAFNASGFYLRDTYDAASVNAYAAYDKTSVGTLVVTNGKIVRNAYQYAVKTWYIAGVDASNKLRIYEDTATKEEQAKKTWGETVAKQIRNTFTFASPLVENKGASTITTSMPSATAKLNRQAICQIDSNNFALITGSNLSRQDLIDIMLQLNCETGTNFDGGGSIALLIKSKNSNQIETIIGNARALPEVGYFYG